MDHLTCFEMYGVVYKQIYTNHIILYNQEVVFVVST